MKDLKQLLKYLGAYRWDMVIGMLLIVVETAFELFIPMLMADLIDVGVANRDISYILNKGVQMGLCALFALITGLLYARFAARAASLRDEAETLREYTMQLWQVCHANIELRQTRVTTWLTVVATVFLPLDLVTGWYGMNFPNMLAPGVPWGYPAVASAAALLALGGQYRIWMPKEGA